MTTVNSVSYNMARRRKNTPDFPLNVVKRFVQDGVYNITNSAKESAERDFGWYEADIKKAILALKTRDFARSVEHDTVDDLWFDHYEPDDLLGYAVYIHLHIEDGELWILSFKKNTRGET